MGMDRFAHLSKFELIRAHLALDELRMLEMRRRHQSQGGLIDFSIAAFLKPNLSAKPSPPAMLAVTWAGSSGTIRPHKAESTFKSACNGAYFHGVEGSPITTASIEL